ncbi:MAG: cell wall-active antibiotics response protein [Chlorobi bacterium]|nr:cell wall-active antibiotics response protein [Chlorobiota bacterium]
MYRNIAYTILVLISSNLIAGASVEIVQEIPRTTEKALRVNIDCAFESIVINRGEKNSIVAISRKGSLSGPEPQLRYHISNGIGYLVIEFNENDDKSLSFFNGKNRKQTWIISFSHDLPIDFNIDIGFGKADLDLTGLQTSGLKLSSGASKISLRVNTKNRIVADRIKLECGIGELRTEHLGNLRFRRLSFEGGIGKYRLDLTGALRRDARIDLEIGLGAMKVYLPEGYAARVFRSDNWLSSIDLPGFINRGNDYFETEDMSSSKESLNIHLECGLGAVKFKWRENP